MEPLALARAQRPTYVRDGFHGFAVTNTLPVEVFVRLCHHPNSSSSSRWTFPQSEWGNGFSLKPKETKDFLVELDTSEEEKVRGKFEFWVKPGMGRKQEQQQGFTVTSYFLGNVRSGQGTRKEKIHGEEQEAFGEEEEDTENIVPLYTTASSSREGIKQKGGRNNVLGISKEGGDQKNVMMNEFEEGVLNLWNKMLTPTTTLVVTGQGGEKKETPHETLVRLQVEATQRREFVKVWSGTHASMKKVEGAIQDGTLSVRKDTDVHRDVGLRERLVELILSYNVAWLALGLAVITGTPYSSQAVTRQATLSLIHTFILSDPGIVSTHTQTRNGPFVSTNPEFGAAISRSIVRQFLSLVLLLDRARMEYPNLMGPTNSRLFGLGSGKKSSEAILIEFGGLVLAGEGNFVYHLKSLDYQVSHHQTALDEYQYRIRDLGEDFRDGIALARVAQLYCGVDVMQAMRVPATTRTHKLGNVQRLLSALEERDAVDLNAGRRGRITNVDIVDGNLDKTLALVWRITVKFSLASVVSREALVKEIKRLRALLLNNNNDVVVNVENKEEIDEKMEHHELLLCWCETVYALNNNTQNNDKVTDFSGCLADGRVLCTLVHHYHPELLPASAFGSPLMPPRANFAALRTAVDALGSVPLRLDAPTGNKKLDAKLAFAFVAYLSARLLGSFSEGRSATAIQKLWRGFQHRKRNPLPFVPRINVAKLRAEAQVRMRRQNLKPTETNVLFDANVNVRDENNTIKSRGEDNAAVAKAREDDAKKLLLLERSRREEDERLQHMNLLLEAEKKRTLQSEKLKREVSEIRRAHEEASQQLLEQAKRVEDKKRAMALARETELAREKREIQELVQERSKLESQLVKLEGEFVRERESNRVECDALRAEMERVRTELEKQIIRTNTESAIRVADAEQHKILTDALVHETAKRANADVDASEAGRVQLERVLRAERKKREDLQRELEMHRDIQTQHVAQQQLTGKEQDRPPKKMGIPVVLTKLVDAAVTSNKESVAGASALFAALSNDPLICASLASSSETIARVLCAARRCTRSEMGVETLAHLLKSLSRLQKTHPESLGSKSPVGPLFAATIVDIMQTFYDCESVFQAAIHLVPIGSLIATSSLTRLRVLRDVMLCRSKMKDVVAMATKRPNEDDVVVVRNLVCLDTLLETITISATTSSFSPRRYPRSHQDVDSSFSTMSSSSSWTNSPLRG